MAEWSVPAGQQSALDEQVACVRSYQHWVDSYSAATEAYQGAPAPRDENGNFLACDQVLNRDFDTPGDVGLEPPPD